MQNTPCSAPSTVVTQARHGGRNGCLTVVTQVFYNTCVTVQKGVIMAVKPKRIKCAKCGGLGHMTLDTGGKGTFGIQFTEKYVACDKTKR